ncbi:MAG: class I SAM-dependent methyltransferase [Chloroflexi bacterium]|nr:MAG: class I SAM-dependent methyltransferase [Chloroflexota bacterium]
MNLLDIINRAPNPEPWSEGEKIPWNDPDFSRRMLKEHLSQAHDAASRRQETIEKHVRWIDDRVLSGKPAKVLDLGCGPGLYTHLLAQRGHMCTGIDFGPASIEYARKRAQEEKTSCTYLFEDVRLADFGSGYDLIMFLFGEFNVFRPEEANAILEKAHQALNRGGKILLEVHTFEAVEKMGKEAPLWYSAKCGIFSDEPYLSLEESFWNEDRAVATNRYYVVDPKDGSVQKHASSTKAYTEAEYKSLLETARFQTVRSFPSLIGEPHPPSKDFFVLIGEK